MKNKTLDRFSYWQENMPYCQAEKKTVQEAFGIKNEDKVLEQLSSSYFDCGW